MAFDVADSSIVMTQHADEDAPLKAELLLQPSSSSLPDVNYTIGKCFFLLSSSIVIFIQLLLLFYALLGDPCCRLWSSDSKKKEGKITSRFTS